MFSWLDVLITSWCVTRCRLRSCRVAITSVLEDKEEILFALDEKLDEEVCDYQVTKEMAELADVLEVIHAIAEANGITFEELDQIRLHKRETRGGFTKMILLEEIIE